MARAKSILILGAAGALLLAAGTAVAAGHARTSPKAPGPHLFDRIAARLGLTADQRSEIRDVVAKHWSSGLGDAAKNARLARRDLRNAIHDPGADDASIRRAAHASAAAEEDLAVQRHATYVEAFSILTPQQRDTAKALAERRAARRDRRFAAIDGALRGE